MVKIAASADISGRCVHPMVERLNPERDAGPSKCSKTALHVNESAPYDSPSDASGPAARSLPFFTEREMIDSVACGKPGQRGWAFPPE
jgi:hypothetical protein